MDASEYNGESYAESLAEQATWPRVFVPNGCGHVSDCRDWREPRDGWDRDDGWGCVWLCIGMELREDVEWIAEVTFWSENLAGTEWWEAEVSRKFGDGVDAIIKRTFGSSIDARNEAMAWAEGVIAAWDYLWLAGGGK